MGNPVFSCEILCIPYKILIALHAQFLSGFLHLKSYHDHCSVLFNVNNNITIN